MNYLKQTLCTISLISVLAGCQDAAKKQTQAATKPAEAYDPLKGLPASQKRVLLVQKQYDKMFTAAPNDIAKKDVQDKFDTWLKGYLLDTLKGKLNTWAATVKNVDEGQLNGGNYVIADFSGYLPSGYEGLTLRLTQEIDYPGSYNITKSPLHAKIKDLKVGGAVRLNAQLVSFGDFYVSDNPGFLRFPEFNIKLESAN